ncbi:DUF3558 domain-containing protein [Nocardia sp. NPDC059180]|uniref:DUF3558 domain-containing protein n=1 Tax=Nocardia sp. NPDC059180 TaxID=3346761 RepID=UPI00367BD50F
MTGRLYRSAAATGCALALAATGCGSGTTGTAVPTSSVEAQPSTAQPASFDPCTDIPQAILDAENLANQGPDTSRSGEITWTGCSFRDKQADGYDVRVVNTTLTLDQLQKKFADSYRETTFSGRRAAYYALFPDLGSESCVVNVEMANGTLEFELYNPEVSSRTGDIPACDLVTDLAEQIVAVIPPGA